MVVSDKVFPCRVKYIVIVRPIGGPLPFYSKKGDCGMKCFVFPGFTL